MEYTAQFTYDCLWRVDGEKRVCTGGHESDGYPCNCISHLLPSDCIYMHSITDSTCNMEFIGVLNSNVRKCQ